MSRFTQIYRLSDIKIEWLKRTEWVITTDFLNEIHCGRSIVFGIKLCRPQIINHPQSQQFRLFDVSDKLRYAGWALRAVNSDGFEPLDQFGLAAGCTEIRWFEDGKWVKYYDTRRMA